MASIQRRITGGGERWRVMFRHGGRQLSRSFLTEADARRWKALLEVAGPAAALKALDETSDQDVPTVAQRVEHHIAHLTSVTAGTASDYRRTAARHIAPQLGSIPLTLLTRDRVTEWVIWLHRTRGLSAKSVKNAHSLLSSVLLGAVRDGLIPGNVAEGVPMPKDSHERVEMVTLTPEESLDLIHAHDPRWRPLVALLVGTGLRFGEATALQVGDLDLAHRHARIRRAWKHTDGHGYELGVPKSRRSRRTIYLGGVADILAPLVDGRPADAFVIVNAAGSPVRHQHFHAQGWTPAVRRFAGDVRHVERTGERGRPRSTWVPGPGKRPRIHDLRHTYASQKIGEGKSMAWVQRQLGHEDISTTIRLYTHLETSHLEQLGDSVDWTSLRAGA